FTAKQSGMSHHLKVLHNAGLLTSRKEGNSIFYRRAYFAPDHSLAALQQQLFATLDQQVSPVSVTQALQELKQERGAAAQQFFSDNAHKFRAQQDLIASYPIYAEQISQLLNNTPVRANNLALEVGPGEGEFLSVLAKRFKHVIALDNATSMLEKSRSFAN